MGAVLVFEEMKLGYFEVSLKQVPRRTPTTRFWQTQNFPPVHTKFLRVSVSGAHGNFWILKVLKIYVPFN
jgi:hypothetical protein